jgi:hypothetical protein
LLAENQKLRLDVRASEAAAAYATEHGNFLCTCLVQKSSREVISYQMMDLLCAQKSASHPGGVAGGQHHIWELDLAEIHAPAGAYEVQLCWWRLSILVDRRETFGAVPLNVLRSRSRAAFNCHAVTAVLGQVVCPVDFLQPGMRHPVSSPSQRSGCDGPPQLASLHVYRSTGGRGARVDIADPSAPMAVDAPHFRYRPSVMQVISG